MSIDVMVPVWKHGPTQPHLRLLMLALADNANAHGVCWPSVETLAAKCAVEPRTLQRNLRALEDAGWIVATQRPGRSTWYQIVLERLTPDAGVTPDASVTPTPDVRVTPTPDADATPPLTPTSPEPSGTPKRNRQGEPTPARATLTAEQAAEFDQFWSLYPQRKGKQAAVRAWPKARRLADLETILEGVRRYLQDDRVARGYVKDPATWLNQGCWDDEPTTVTAVQQAQQQADVRTVQDRQAFGDHWANGGAW